MTEKGVLLGGEGRLKIKPFSIIKQFLPVRGIVILLSIFFGGSYKQLIDWSTAELVGFNFVIFMELVAGIWFIYGGIKEIRGKRS